VTEPDRLSALSQRVVAVTGRTLTREQLVTLVGQAFEHDLNLDDDGQLRGLVGGLLAADATTATRAGDDEAPPISYAQPQQPYAQPQSSYLQQQPYPVRYPGPMPTPGPMRYPMPPPRPPAPPMRHPAGFIVAGILVAIAAVGIVLTAPAFAVRMARAYHASTPMAGFSVAWLAIGLAFGLIAVAARPAGKGLVGRAVVTALATLPPAVVPWVGLNLTHTHDAQVVFLLLAAAAALTWSIAVIVFGAGARSSFRLFGTITGTGAGITSLGLTLLYGLFAAQMVMGLSRSLVRHLSAPLLGVWLVSMVLLLLLGIAISVGRVPVVATATAAPEPPAVDTESDCAPTDTASDPEPAADP
jgi:hypothetical protein